MKKKIYKLDSEVTLYPGMNAWHFGHVDKNVSEEIKRQYTAKKSKGFGSIRVVITVGKTTWNTSIFPDKKTGTYLFPIKADVRKKEGIYAGGRVSFSLEIQ